jgi:capsular polysaccharide biosynthesis protein
MGLLTMLERPAAAVPAPDPVPLAPSQPLSQGGRTLDEVSPDRVSVIWRAKFVIILVVVVVTLAVYAISRHITPTYSSSSTVRVSATQAPGGSASDVVSASNDLAAQYAELVTSSAVLDPAASAARTTGGELSTHISAGTVSSQNLIRVTAQSPNREQAQVWANDVASSLSTYVKDQSAQQAATIQASLTSQLRPISREISALEASIDQQSASAVAGTAGYVRVQSEESQLTELLTTRSDLLTTTAVSIAADQPQVGVLFAAGAPTQVSPKPTLYAIIAAIGSLVAACEIALARARRRFRSPSS